MNAGKKNKNKFELNLIYGIICYENPKLLGITFDESLNFKVHTENLLKKVKYHQNI